MVYRRDVFYTGKIGYFVGKLAYQLGTHQVTMLQLVQGIDGDVDLVRNPFVILKDTLLRLSAAFCGLSGSPALSIVRIRRKLPSNSMLQARRSAHASCDRRVCGKRAGLIYLSVIKMAEMAVKLRALTGRFTSKRLTYATPTGEFLKKIRNFYGPDIYPGAQ